jgi:hypothetical protein
MPKGSSPRAPSPGFDPPLGFTSHRTDTETRHVGMISIFHNELKVQYSARKAIPLIVEVAYAGGAHMILAILTVSLVLSA